MRIQRKGSFFNFLCAFLPGASEMYMGFMKKGVSLMALFFASFGIISLLQLSDVFVFVPAIIWFYGFFHARNLTNCDPQYFMTLQDDYIWNEILGEQAFNIKSETAKKWGAWALIIAGICMLFNMIVVPIVDFLNFLADNLGWFWVEYIQEFIGVLPRFVIAVLIILLGVKLIRGKKKALDINGSPVDVIAGQIQQTADNLTANGGE
ncbi:MAG: hypothetical protein E7301_12360 [Butyrivibrio sp.]|nr:hypothetical protein [Butyrivibrio sp.]